MGKETLGCNCTSCGAKHEENKCPNLANSYDGKCNVCNAALTATAHAVGAAANGVTR